VDDHGVGDLKSSVLVSRLKTLLPAAVFLACMAIYLPTLNPAFRADDSPETAATSVILGIQHPPAYPLQTLVGRLASRFPLGSEAWRLNLLAAGLGALACAMLCLLAFELGCRWLRLKGEREGSCAWGGCLAGLVAGLGLGGASTFWSQSLAAKGGIYTLQMSLLAATLLLLQRWAASVEDASATDALTALRQPSLRGAVLLLGLGLANHWETQALVIMVCTFWMGMVLAGLSRRGPLSAWVGPLSALAGLGLAGPALYLYLPLRARLYPPLNWGDPSDWQQFCWVVLRQEYLDLETGFLKSLRAVAFGGGSWAAVVDNWSVVQRQGLRVLSHLAGPHADIGVPLSLLSLPGWAVLRPVRRPWTAGTLAKLGVALAAMVLLFVAVVTFYFHLKEELVWILDVFLLPLYLVQALLAGLGLLWMLRRWTPRVFQGVAAWLACLALLLGLPTAVYALRYRALSQADQYLAWDYAQDLLLSLKPNAILLAEGDFNTMPIYYLQRVRGQRPDVDHITTVFLSTDWGVDLARHVQPRLGIGEVQKAITGARAGDGQVLRAALRQVMAANLPARPVYASLFREVLAANVPEWEPAGARPDGWSWRPSGLVSELRPTSEPDSPLAETRRLGLLKAYRSRHLSLDRANLEPSPAFALSNYGTAFLDTALYLRSHHRAREAMGLYQEAVQWTSRANLAEVWTHYGIALGEGQDGLKSDLPGAITCFKNAIAVKPIFEAWTNLAGAYNQLGQQSHLLADYQQAEAAARQALALSPASPQAWNVLAVSVYYQGRKTDAVQILRQAAQLAPQDPQILGNLRALGGS
jgi:tetratricopeptide (TPR) repeat protein